jgi:hypothetical protein
MPWAGLLRRSEQSGLAMSITLLCRAQLPAPAFPAVHQRSKTSWTQVPERKQREESPECERRELGRSDVPGRNRRPMRSRASPQKSRRRRDNLLGIRTKPAQQHSMKPSCKKREGGWHEPLQPYGMASSGLLGAQKSAAEIRRYAHPARKAKPRSCRQRTQSIAALLSLFDKKIRAG